MSNDDAKTLPVREQFRRAALGACRPARAYDALKSPASLAANPSGSQSDEKSKSYAQVESFVSQPIGSHNSGELKLNGPRTYRVVTRFTQDEKESVVIQAQKHRMTVSDYVRLVLLKQPGLDPERNGLLNKVHFELTKQGTNLNQIAKQLNAGTVTNGQGASMVAMISRSLRMAHQVVLDALSEGRTAE